MNNSGTVTNHLKYDSYGNVIAESNPAAETRYQFTGREFDDEIHLQYSRARYYDSAIGRFISEDPSGFGGNNSNLYAYVDNAPSIANDPSGLKSSIGSYARDAQSKYDDAKGKVEKGKGNIDRIAENFGRIAESLKIFEQARNRRRPGVDVALLLAKANIGDTENQNAENFRQGQQAYQCFTVPVQEKLQDVADNSLLGKLQNFREKIKVKYDDYQTWRKARTENGLAEYRSRTALKVQSQRRI